MTNQSREAFETAAANELLRALDREAFNGSIDIAKLPEAVGLVMDFRQAALSEGRSD